MEPGVTTRAGNADSRHRLVLLQKVYLREQLKIPAVNGLTGDGISVSSPVVTDRSAQTYGENDYRFRYVASQIVTIYSDEVERVREIMNNMSELGRQPFVVSTIVYYLSD